MSDTGKETKLERRCQGRWYRYWRSGQGIQPLARYSQLPTHSAPALHINTLKFHSEDVMTRSAEPRSVEQV
jgi:hypothetical protein